MMKRFLLLSIITCSLLAKAQYTDDFSDGNFTVNPLWSGTTEKFVVDNGILQLDDKEASGSGSFKAYLSTPSEAVVSAQWQMRVVADVNLTSYNYVRYYLIADRADFLDDSLTGYFVLVGGAKKNISLYKQNGKAITKIIDGTDNRLNVSLPNELEIKITCDDSFNWQLYSKLSSENDFRLEGQTESVVSSNCLYSGVYLSYSSSNKNKYSFDDFVVVGDDYTPPVNNSDRHSLVFNEVMVDPEPAIGVLPNAEYIELYNRTEKAIDLSGFVLECGRGKGIIEEGVIAAKGYLLLCDYKYKSDFENFGNIDVANMSYFPSLSNGGALINLKTPEGNTVAWTDYSDEWYGDDNLRKEGGFSLERVDVNNLNNDVNNWRPSNDTSGGTPGRVNSSVDTNPDTEEPKLIAVSLLNDNSCQLIFNKEMSLEKITSLYNYISSDVAITKAVAVEPCYNRLTLTFAPTLSSDTIEIEINNLTCVSDFSMDKVSFRLAKPQSVLRNDVVINELMYNTDDNTAEYIELYNNSNKVINIAQLFMSRRYKGNLDAKKTISNDSVLLFPHQYLLLSRDIEAVCSRYACGIDGINIETYLNSLSNTEGNVVICLNNADIIDEFDYSDKMQSPSVIDSRGVSLERINPHKPTNDINNWASASFTEDYGTPSRQNSQYDITDSQSDDRYWLDYETFTPDNDGFRDFLLLNYKFDEQYNITATVYNPIGVKVKVLCNNLIAGSTGVIRWDGSAENGSLADVGIYVIKIVAVGTEKVLTDKIVCVLGMK